MKRRVLVKVLRRNGLVQFAKRGKGSHAWFEHPHDPSRCTTVPDYDEISRDLLSDILHQVKKTREEYEERLREV